MREIKFRIWNTYTKEMGPIIQLKGKTQTFLEDNHELMQYTGLKDRHGKEIYEGDIVNVDGREDPHLCEFVQKDSGGRFQFTHPKKGVWSCFPKPKIEIIGNIYENLDLLTPISYEK